MKQKQAVVTFPHRESVHLERKTRFKRSPAGAGNPQAAHWAGFSEAYLRRLIKRSGGSGERRDLPRITGAVCRLPIPRDGFKAWFNRCQTK